MAPSTTGNAIRYGVNYASGAAGILDSSGYAFVRNLETQSQNLLAEISVFQLDVKELHLQYYWVIQYYVFCK